MPRRTSILRRPITRWTLTILGITIFAAWCITAIAGAIALFVPFSYCDDTYLVRFSYLAKSGAITFKRSESPLSNDSQPSFDVDVLSYTLITPPSQPSNTRMSAITWRPCIDHSTISQDLWHLTTYQYNVKFLPGDVYFSTWSFTLPLWIPFLFFSFLTYRSWKLHLAHRAALRAHHCPHCNYSRTGLTPSSPCPECGTPITTPTT